MNLFEHIFTVITLLEVVYPNWVTASSNGATDIEEIADTAFRHIEKKIGLSLDNTPTFSLLTQWIDRRGLHRKRVYRHKPEPAVSNCVIAMI